MNLMWKHKVIFPIFQKMFVFHRRESTNSVVSIGVLLSVLNQQNQRGCFPESLVFLRCCGWAAKGLIAEAEEGWALKWPATCNLKVKYGSSGSPITVYSLMGTLQTRILGAQRAPLFSPSAALCHNVGNSLIWSKARLLCLHQCDTYSQLFDLPVWTTCEHVTCGLVLSVMHHFVLTVHNTRKTALCHSMKQLWESEIWLFFSPPASKCVNNCPCRACFPSIFTTVPFVWKKAQKKSSILGTFSHERCTSTVLSCLEL